MPRDLPNKQSTSAADGSGMTKFEAVRRALAELGPDAMPLSIKDYLRKNFGIDMEPQNISNYKSTLKASERRAPNRQREAKGAAETSTGGFSLEEIQAVKEVADRIGADKVRQLAQVLSK
jgi:hypothetical protein